jgi:hypothetical protein
MRLHHQCALLHVPDDHQLEGDGRLAQYFGAEAVNIMACIRCLGKSASGGGSLHSPHHALTSSGRGLKTSAMRLRLLGVFVRCSLPRLAGSCGPRVGADVASTPWTQSIYHAYDKPGRT